MNKPYKLIRCIFCLILLIGVVYVSPAQYILVNPAPVTDQAILQGDYSKHTILNLNCMSSQPGGKFLIHFVVFSDAAGNFNKRPIGILQLKQLKTLPLDSIIAKAVINTGVDQQREITHFEYEGDYNKYPIRCNGYKIAMQTSKDSVIVYDNYTLTFFYQVRDFKQFTTAQSCASAINTQSTPEPTKRIGKNSIPEIDFPDTPYSDYFPNKLFLEKINNDSTYHFIRYRQLCMDCTDNENFEFDFDRLKGITRFWYYLPKATGEKRKYVRFSSDASSRR